MSWFSRGEIDGFFGLVLDNLIQTLLIIGLCTGLLGFSQEIILGSVLPGVAVSLLLGNLAYSWMAKRLAEREGRQDVTALPYGINTPSVFVLVFMVMLPVKLKALGAGLTPDQAAYTAWQAGLAACLGSALIECLGAFLGSFLRSLAPRAAMLATLSGIALGFISLPFVYRTFAQPLVGFTTLAIILVSYFGKVRFRAGISGGFLAVAVGTALAWATGLAPSGTLTTASLGMHVPRFVGADLWEAIRQGYLSNYLNIIIPIGAFNVIGSLQNLESAEAAGDRYNTMQAMLVNGIGSMAAALFGSCFPTTIYIGHPGWKAMGARSSYSTLSGICMTVLCLSGSAALIFWAVPIEAGMAIVLWIGIVISAQAFQATPKHHAPAAVLGIMVGLAAFGTLMVKAGLRAADAVLGGTLIWKDKAEALTQALAQSDLAAAGLFSVEQGTIFSAMIFAAITVEVIEQKFRRAAVWALVGAALSGVGLIHAYAWDVKDVSLQLQAAPTWALGYLVMAIFLGIAPWITVPSEQDPHGDSF